MSYTIRRVHAPLTANRRVVQPDASGTIILDSMLGTVNGQLLTSNIIIKSLHLGVFKTLGELQTAYPTGPSEPNSYAYLISAEAGADTFLIYTWDSQHGEWDHTGTSNFSINDTDGLVEGLNNRYFTEQRVRNTPVSINTVIFESIAQTPVVKTDTVEDAIRKLALSVNPLRQGSGKLSFELDTDSVLLGTTEETRTAWFTTDLSGLSATNQIGISGGFALASLRGNVLISLTDNTSLSKSIFVDFVVGVDGAYTVMPGIFNEMGNDLDVLIEFVKDDVNNCLSLKLTVPEVVFQTYPELTVLGTATVQVKYIH